MKPITVTIVGSLSVLILNMMLYVETDPKWIMYLHNVVWFAFGCALGESQYEKRVIRALHELKLKLLKEELFSDKK